MDLSTIPLARASRELWLQLLSVFIPGFLLLTEVAITIQPQIFNILIHSALNSLTITLFLVLTASGSYMLGLYYSRCFTLSCRPHEKGSRWLWVDGYGEWRFSGGG